MTAALLTLLILCAVLVFLVIGRDRGACREEARLHRIADALANELALEQVKVRHLQERNADLRDELDIAQGRGSSLVAEWTAALADITPEDFR